jgi:rSAM/selenodomain-associated transferase 2
MTTPKISLVVPVLNEASDVVETLSALQPLRAAGHELIVVDGGSTDDSIALSQPYSDRVMRSLRGRSRQMNAGASAAGGDIFLFLHADTFLPAGADRLIIEGLKRHRKSWGRFDVRLSGKHLLLRVVGYLMNIRSRITGTATGDQAIFVRRELFEKVGGFPDIDLMEDIALSKRLKRKESPLCLWQRVLTSSRRWERNGILRTILFMWHLRLLYFLGSDPGRLAQQYERNQPS